MSLVPTQESQKSLLDSAIALGKDGMFLDALEVLQSCGPLDENWAGAERCEVSWIVGELGAPRFSRRHVLKAYRESPESLVVRGYYAQHIADVNGPLDALEFIEASPQPADTDDPEERLKWLWLQLSSYAHLRDFSTAGQFIEAMEAIGHRPDLPHFARALWWERQDQQEKAMEAIDRAVAEREGRSTVCFKAYLLMNSGHDNQAYDLLGDFDQRTQIAALPWMMSLIAYERRDYADCARTLERFEALSPLMERGFGQQFTLFRCELARRTGDDAKAIEYARQAKSAIGNKFAERLADPQRMSRVDKILPVEFVRQHTMTCGPATLSAIGRFWNRPTEHLEVAEEICYNGTSHHAEREWANQNGFATREFTVDEAATESLIGRDVPFTLVTRGPGFAHLQAVIGYDGRTGSILVRDPSHRVRGTMGADELFESQAAHGPRGMVLEQAMKLRPNDAELVLSVVESLATTSSEHWARAEALLQSVKGSAPERNWSEAASRLAVVQGDWAKGLEHLQELLPRSPLAMGLRERIVELMVEVEGEDAAREFWRSAAEQFPHYQPLVERHAMALRSCPLEEIEPVLNHILELNPENAWAVRELSQHLLSAGKLAQAEAMVARCVELDAEDSTTKLLQALLDSRRGDNASARARLREMLASDISHEYAVSQLIGYCETLEQRTEALEWVLSELRRQPISGDVLMVYRDHAEAVLSEDKILEAMQQAVAQRGELWPAHQALIRQLTQMQRLDEARHAAEKAAGLFPLEPNTWYELFQVATAMGDPALQRVALEQCRLLRPNHATVSRALSDLLCSEGNYADAREMLQSLVAAQPLDAVNRGYLADVLLELDEKEAALGELATAISLQPDYDFAWARFDELAAELERPDARLELSQRLTVEKPHSAGAWLQHARGLAGKERFEEAHQAIDRAEALEPYRESVYSFRAQTLANAGNFEAAIAALQPAIFPTIPPALVLTRAQLLWDIGAQDAAYELLQTSAEQNPEAMNLWGRLEQWANARDDRATAIRAVEHQVKMQPHNPEVLDAAGNAFMNLENKVKAIEAFRHAVEIAPTFAGSRCNLFDLLVEQGEWDEASRVIRDLPRIDQHPTVIARRLQVSLHQNDLEQADSDVVGIFVSDEWSPWAADRATELMKEAKLTARLLELIEQGLSDKSFNENSARVWVGIKMDETEILEKHRIDTVTQRIDRWIAGEHPAAGRAAISMLIHIFSVRNMSDQLQRFVSKNKPMLCEDPHSWSMVTFAYADNPALFTSATLRDWIGGWEAREDYEPWMFANIHELCRIVGDHAGGRRAVQMALAMPPDHMQSQFRLWSAHDALVGGDAQLALRHFMGAARLEYLNGHERLMHHCIEAILHMRQSSDKAATFKAVRKQLDDLQLTAKFFTKQPVYRSVYENAVKSIAKSANSLSARWWMLAKLVPLKLRTLFPV